MNYQAPYRLLGLPLLHINTGEVINGDYRRGMAKGWIAIGDMAFGLFLAIGATACGGIALGGIGVGLISLSGLSLGIFAMGGLSLGIWSFGGAALALHAAMGGLAVAKDFAEGGLAIARQANNPIAQEYLGHNAFFNIAKVISRYSMWFLLLLVIPPLLHWLKKRSIR